MKALRLPKQLDNIPRVAVGWAFDPVTKTMGLYGNGVKIQSHLCDKDYPHDVYECNYKDFDKFTSK